MPIISAADPGRYAPRGIKRITREFRRELLELISGYGDGLDGNPLGCGGYGCVWSILKRDRAAAGGASPTRYVLKISTDKTEGPVVQAIINTRWDKQLDGLVRWEGVWRVPTKIGRTGLAWVIVREDVEPFRPVPHHPWWGSPAGRALGLAERTDAELAYWAREEYRWGSALDRYNNAARDAIRLKTASRVERARDEMAYAVGDLYGDEQTYPVAEAIEALDKSGITLADVHRGNLGHRIHGWPDPDDPSKIVWPGAQEAPEPLAGSPFDWPRYPLLIFDPGHSSWPEGVTVSPFERIVRANPALADLADAVPVLP